MRKRKSSKQKRFTEYKEFVNSNFKHEPDTHYDMMRAGLELAEEWLEYMESESDTELEEIGDVLYWFGWFSDVLVFDLTDTKGFEFSEELNVIVPALHSSILSFVGCVKRYYRDKNNDKLDEMRAILPNIQLHIENLIDVSFKITIEELMELNTEKLVNRNKK